MAFKKPAVSAIIVLVGLVTIICLSGLNFLIPQRTRTDEDKSAPARQSLDKGGDELGYDNMDKISLTTQDRIKIAADLYPIANPRLWLVLVHMMPATKESYKEFAEKLQSLDYESLAIDLRGHGQSDAGPDGFRNFSNEEHQKSVWDLQAAADYLIKNRKATSDKIIFIGASIGANLSLQYVVENPEFRTAVLLSPGLNYCGIAAESLVKNLKPDQRIFFVSAEDDSRVANNTEQTQTLYDLTLAGPEKKIQIYESGDHGTDILKNQPDLADLIKSFISE